MDVGQDKFESWGMLELFGHQRIAGRITEQTIGGCSFVRVDVPECEGIPAYTRMFGQGAIYALTITSEDVARRLAATMRARPVKPYELTPPALPAFTAFECSDDDEL